MKPSSTTASSTIPQALGRAFLGNTPDWYKIVVAAFLIINPVALIIAGPFVTGWLVLMEFIFTLAMALKCYPLQPGGLLAIESVILGLASPEAVYREAELNFGVILLLMFMVAGIYFLRDLLTFVFTKLLVRIHSKLVLSLLFSSSAAVLSAFLDALTVMAVVITVATGLYGVYHRVVSGGRVDLDDDGIPEPHTRRDLERFRGFLRSLVMHAAVGTALGGVCTLVGEPQNLLIGNVVGWEFQQFFLKMAPVSLPVLAAGLVTCVCVERFGWFGYGEALPEEARKAIVHHDRERALDHTVAKTVRLVIQAAVAALLVLGLALHIAEVGLIGLSVIVLATAFCGVIEEKKIGHAFEEALPFTALLVTFFAVVAVIHEQHLFAPVIDLVLASEGQRQLVLMYLANGLLSAISDNVFVATVYISSIKEAFDAGRIGREQFELLAVAVNTGTNIPSVATPNGQAAFLFLLTSALAPLIRLGYGRMMWMALPYTVVMTPVGLLAVQYLL
ncbi:MAG: sodium/proton antiporter NhaB [Rhodospirillaceae bacterium]